MARGFVAGGVSFGLFSLACAALCGLVPMWLVSRTELVDSYCWLGEGIWKTSVRWGDDIEQLRLTCNSQASKAASTAEVYCGEVETAIPYGSSYKNSMCRVTRTAKALVIAGVSFMAVGVFSGIGSHMANRFKTQIFCSIGATLASCMSLVSMASLFVLIQTSPMFSDEHYKALSHDLLNKYESVSCNYQLPSVWNFLRYGKLDGPMTCLFPGPSFAFCIAAIIGSAMTMTLFALKWREALLIRHISLQHRYEGELEWTETHSPLFGGNVNASPSLSPSPSPGGLLSISPLLSPGAAMPSNFKFERHYSLYGAFQRHFSHRSSLIRHLVNALPAILNITHVVILGLWIMNGLAYAIHIELDEVKHTKKHDELMLSEPLVNLSAQILNENFAPNFERAGLFKPIHFSALQQVIEFSPITTLSVFFRAQSYSFGIIQLVAIFMWPVLKALLWSWFWYTPADEVFRGRIFSWIDALGKLTLANLFINCLLAIVNYFTREIYIPWLLIPALVFPFHSLRVRIEFAINPGFGTYGFVISFVLTMVMGEAYVLVHRFAKRWEEDRRAMEEKSWNLPAVVESSSFAVITREDEGHYFGVQDSPYLMMAETHDSLSKRMAKKKSRLLRRSRRAKEPTGIDESSIRASPRQRLLMDTNETLETGNENEGGSENQLGEEEYEVESDEAGEEALDNRTPPQIPTVQNEGIRVQGSTRPYHIGDHIDFLDDGLDGQVAFYETHREEALCNHIFSPFSSTYVRFTRFGKFLIASLAVGTLVSIFFAEYLETFVFERAGLVGDLIIPREQRNVTMSVFTVPRTLYNAGLFGRIPLSMTAVVFLFVIVMPMVHVCGLCVMWFVPLTPKAQRQLILAMEIVSAWSALDVFTAVLLFTHFDVESFTRELIEAAGFSVVDKVLIHTPFDSFIIEKQHLHGSFTILVVAVVLEKVLEHLVQSQFATMISERDAVRQIAKSALAVRDFVEEPGLARIEEVDEDQSEELESEIAHGAATTSASAGSQSGAGLDSTPRRGRRGQFRMSGSLIRNHMDVLSPTQGYFFASGLPGWFYAGLPVKVWKALIKLSVVEVDYTFTDRIERSTWFRETTNDNFQLDRS